MFTNLVNALRFLALLAALLVGHASEHLNAATPEFTIETLVRGLDTPWSIDFAPDGRIFISERDGRIRVVERNQLQPEFLEVGG